MVVVIRSIVKGVACFICAILMYWMVPMVEITIPVVNAVGALESCRILSCIFRNLSFIVQSNFPVILTVRNLIQ